MSQGQFVVGSQPYVAGVSGTTFIFETANFDPPGHLPDQLVDIEEELKDVGVDKTRYRLTNRQFRPFRLTTLQNFATYEDGETAHQKTMQAIKKIGALTVSLYGNSRRWVGVKIDDAVPKLYAGNMVGSGVNTSLAVIVCDWQMILTNQTGHA